MIAGVAAKRDPLAIEYDDFAVRFLGLLQSDPFGWHTARVTSPPGDPVDNGGLTHHERALQQSLYYNLNSTAAAGPLGGRWVKNREWSLQRGRGNGWSDPEYTGGILGRLFRTAARRRVLTCRIVRGFSAREAAAAKPASELYTVNPDARSQSLGL
jgi:hypothetical protein